MDDPSVSETTRLEEAIRMARRRLVDMHYQARSGHLGGNLSCLDALMAVHHGAMGPDDRFVLSKGHSAGAYYVVLWSLGLLSDADLDTFGRDGTRLPGHPPSRGLPGVLFATGSLGHGPSLAAGLALAARLTGSGRRIWCLTSDGEWQEGSCWEALILARHQGLDNLTVLVDVNGFQGFGSTAEVASFDDLPARLAGFGLDVDTVPGHDAGALLAAMRRPASGGPRVLCLRTVKGKGLPFFENTLASHYLPLTPDQHRQALEGLGGVQGA